jgi:formamidopyrimidine-DNA glycosylase
MPEMPEVETTRRDLEGRIVGRTIVDAWAGEGSPQPQSPLTIEQFRDAVAGRRIERLDRRGKYLIAALSGGLFLILHRRMTGNLVLREAGGERDRFLRAMMTLDDGSELHWDDQRRFGTWVLTEDPAVTLQAVGPEPLADDWTAVDLGTSLRNRTAPIKATLLDQRRVAGLGNIYVDEALHRARIHPLRAAGSLSEADVARLHEAIRFVLEKGIQLQGSSARNYVGGMGQRGTMQEQWQVYERDGLACYSCGGEVLKTRVAGRGTHVCPVCQPAP